jgi:hypothetical protein
MSCVVLNHQITNKHKATYEQNRSTAIYCIRIIKPIHLHIYYTSLNLNISFQIPWPIFRMRKLFPNSILTCKPPISLYILILELHLTSVIHKRNVSNFHVNTYLSVLASRNERGMNCFNTATLRCYVPYTLTAKVFGINNVTYFRKANIWHNHSLFLITFGFLHRLITARSALKALIRNERENPYAY